jgi:formylglycine-generating enzyme required for sulfatase activity
MKAKLLFLFTLLALLGGIDQAAAQEARFFRISGPVATRITEFRPDGTLVWTNAPTNATFTVQTVAFLPGGTNWVDYVQLPVTNSVNTNRLIDFNPPAGMALIPEGSFTMGDSFGDGAAVGWPYEVPLHSVYVSAFYMDKYDVTKSLWDSVYQWATNHGYSFDNAGSGKASTHPVQTIDWDDSVKWCNARSEKEGKVPAYYTSAAQTTVYRTGHVNVDNNSVNWSAGYRLPTEAEWEKAARGGASGQRFPWGNTITESLANYYAYPSGYAYDVNSYSDYNTNYTSGGYPYTSPVGSFAPNGYGLYDMAGNVWQWCWDWWDGSWYSNAGATQNDIRGPTSGSYRVFRGGGWHYGAVACRAAGRGNAAYPANGGSDVGFRSVLPPGQ